MMVEQRFCVVNSKITPLSFDFLLEEKWAYFCQCVIVYQSEWCFFLPENESHLSKVLQQTKSPNLS
jgi:hypothetical protein